MPRHALLASGLVALVLAFGPGPSPGAHAADEPHAKASAVKGALAQAEAEIHQATGHAAPGHDPNILEVQPSLAIWTVLVFLGLLFVLGRFAWKPLLAGLHGREEHLEHVLSETEKARNESERLLAEHRRLLAAAEDQIRAMIDEARKSAHAAADQIIKAAQAEAEASRDRAEREISSAKDEALSEIWSKTADLAVSVAGKVLSKSLSPDDHRHLVDSAVGELQGMAGSRSGGAWS